MSPAQRAVADRSFERLYRRHRRDVYGFALRAVRDPDDAEDVTQSAFLNAYRALHRGDRPEKPRAWLLTIANNIARRQFRDRAIRPREVQLDPELPSNGAEWDLLVAREIEAALRRLRPNKRTAVVLRDIEGCSYAEIAERMGLSESAVETLIFRARNELQKDLEEQGQVPSVSRRRRLRALLVFPLPAGLLSSLDSLMFTLGRAPLATRAAGAVAAAVLGVGVATQAGPFVAEAAADGKVTAQTPATVAPSIPDERLHALPAPDAGEDAKEAKAAKPGGKNAGSKGGGEAAASGGTASSSATGGSDSASSAGGGGVLSSGGSVSVPDVAATLQQTVQTVKQTVGTVQQLEQQVESSLTAPLG